MDFSELVYIETYNKGILKEKVEEARELLKNCTLCPRECRVDRTISKDGICKTGKLACVCSGQPHFGEESPLVGRYGSGTIFFSYCNLLCNFCQNYDISHDGYGREVTNEKLADMMLSLQNQGCHNINFVTPSHIVPQILSAIEIAIKKGLSVPLVYNSSGYDRIDTLKLLDGIIDIYMPDFKFWDSTIAKRACDAYDYPEVARKAIKEMYRQVGDLVIDEMGIARRGLLIRHLVLPKDLAGTKDVMRFIAKEVSPDSYVNIMFQYRPCGDAYEIKELSQSPSREDFEMALKATEEEGITRLDNPDKFYIRLF